MVAAALGLLVNPASGKDVRRLVASASAFDNREKQSILRRVILGALAAGVERFVYLPDGRGITTAAIEGIRTGASFEAVETPCTDSALDTTRAASRMRVAGVGCVVTLGGDGTNRAFALGWPDPPLVAISTGTNNVFPRMLEGSVAGTAAGLVASGRVPVDAVSMQAKVIHLSFDDGPDDLALIDAVLLDEAFTGARAVWNLATVRAVLLARAEPAVVGMSAIGGLLSPLPDSEDAGLALEMGSSGETVIAPIAPGLHEPVSVSRHWRVNPGEPVQFAGPGIVALDGERERRLRQGQHACLTLRRDGPRVVDVGTTMMLAATQGLMLQKKEMSDAH